MASLTSVVAEPGVGSLSATGTSSNATEPYSFWAETFKKLTSLFKGEAPKTKEPLSVEELQVMQRLSADRGSGVQKLKKQFAKEIRKSTGSFPISELPLVVQQMLVENSLDALTFFMKPEYHDDPNFDRHVLAERIREQGVDCLLWRKHLKPKVLDTIELMLQKQLDSTTHTTLVKLFEVELMMINEFNKEKKRHEESDKKINGMASTIDAFKVDLINRNISLAVSNAKRNKKTSEDLKKRIIAIEASTKERDSAIESRAVERDASTKERDDATNKKIDEVKTHSTEYNNQAIQRDTAMSQKIDDIKKLGPLVQKLMADVAADLTAGKQDTDARMEECLEMLIERIDETNEENKTATEAQRRVLQEVAAIESIEFFRRYTNLEELSQEVKKIAEKNLALSLTIFDGVQKNYELGKKTNAKTEEILEKLNAKTTEEMKELLLKNQTLARKVAEQEKKLTEKEQNLLRTKRKNKHLKDFVELSMTQHTASPLTSTSSPQSSPSSTPIKKDSITVATLPFNLMKVENEEDNKHENPNE